MKIEAFRTIIREEVRTVIKEELSLIMSTPITENKIVKKPVVEQKTNKKQTFSEIVNEEKQPQQPQKPTKPLFDSKDPLAQMLNETAASGEWRSLGGGDFTAQNAVGFAGGMPQQQSVPVVDSVEQMSTSKTSDINQVSIDAVPDFSGMMDKFKENGKL
jgi:hypothetical protein|tara:strand:- start:564 stop:1040 length:477 start_codon:yes stop_codon:yes gene_type:complete